MTVTELPTNQTLSMRPVGGGEMDFAYRFAVAVQTGWPRLYQRGAVQAHTFPMTLWEGVECLFQVSGFEFVDGEPVEVPLGFVGIYDLAQRHRTAKVEVVLIPDATQAAVREAAAMIVDYAINTFDLRAVYCEHIDMAPSPFASFDIAVEEGRFVNYVYHRDPDDEPGTPEYWDLVTKTVSAREWCVR